MKKQITPTIKAHLIRGAFYLLLLLAVCAIPFALAQRNVKRSVSSPSPTHTATEGPCIVVNGGFETGSLPPWVNTGDTSNTSVSSGNPHFGIFSLQSGPTISDGFVDQVIPTTAGTAYDVYFWLLNGDSSGNNRFGASFGSVTLVPEASQGQFGWTPYTFTNVIPGANADLHFIFYNPTNLFLLDQVCVALSGGPSVTPTPTPTTTAAATATPTAKETPTPTATPDQITFGARGYKVQGQQRVDLSWNGASSNNVDVYRNGVLVATVPSIPGFYTDNIGRRGKGTYTYRVCDAGTQNCSNQVMVKFGGGG